SHARGKRPPAVEINSSSSYPKNTHLRTNIYFGAERMLGYSTEMSWTSSPRNMGKCPWNTYASTSACTEVVLNTTIVVGSLTATQSLRKDPVRPRKACDNVQAFLYFLRRKSF